MSRGALPPALPCVGSASFICGTLSPVSVDSLTTARPRSSSMSAGTSVDSLPCACRLSETRSDGSSSVDCSGVHLPPRHTSSVVGVADMPRSVVMFFWREKAVVASKVRIMKSVKSVYFQYSSSSHSTEQKSWKHAIGDVICCLYSSPKLGSGMSNELAPKSSRRAVTSRAPRPSAAAYSESGSSVGQSSGRAAASSASSSYCCRWNLKSSRPSLARATGTISGLPRWRGGTSLSSAPSSALARPW